MLFQLVPLCTRVCCVSQNRPERKIKDCMSGSTLFLAVVPVYKWSFFISTLLWYESPPSECKSSIKQCEMSRKKNKDLLLFLMSHDIWKAVSFDEAQADLPKDMAKGNLVNPNKGVRNCSDNIVTFTSFCLEFSWGCRSERFWIFVYVEVCCRYVYRPSTAMLNCKYLCWLNVMHPFSLNLELFSQRTVDTLMLLCQFKGHV